MWSSRRWRPNSTVRTQFMHKEMSWKNILIWTICAHILKYLLVTSYCFLCHLTFYRWSSCSNDHHRPKSFSETSVSVVVSASPCRGGETALVYMPSVYSDFERRQLIRDTWLKDILQGPLKAKFVYVLGIPAVEHYVESHQLKSELSKSDDIILFDIIDHYYNLTQKTRAIFNWTLQNCPDIEYLIRADSDIVLNARTLYRFVHDHLGAIPKMREPIEFGQCRAYDCVTRLPSSKSCLPRAYYESHGRPLFYPSYCIGSSSIVSIEFVRRAIADWKSRMQSDDKPRADYLMMEDLHTSGYTGRSIGAWKVGNRKRFEFDQHFDSYSCQNGPIATAAYDNEEEMRAKWLTYQERCLHFVSDRG